MKLMRKDNSNEKMKNIEEMKYLKLNPIINKKRILNQNKANIKLNTENNIEKFLSQIKRRSINNLHPKDFNQYTENLEKSMNRYQMSYAKDNDDPDYDELNLNNSLFIKT